MSLLTIEGTVTALGNSTFDNNCTHYSFIEIAEKSGRTVRVENAAVRHKVQSAISLGIAGTFYFDRVLSPFARRLRQLYAVRTHSGFSAYDGVSLRVATIALGLQYGILTFWTVIGLIPLIISLCQILKAALTMGARHREFYGDDPMIAQCTQAAGSGQTVSHVAIGKDPMAGARVDKTGLGSFRGKGLGMAVWMIRCPQTGRSVLTGIEIIEAASKRPDTRTFSQCRHCGRVHGWTVVEAWRSDRDEPPKSVWTID